MSWAAMLTAVASTIFPIIKHAMAVTALTLDRLDELEATAARTQLSRDESEILRKASEHLRRRRGA